MILKLPAQINAPRFRKDNSCSISFDTRELQAEELMYILGVRQAEGWLLFSTNETDIDRKEVPTQKPDVGLKTPSARLTDVLYVWYKQQTTEGRFVGDFDSFYKARMESIIEGVKSKLHD